MTDELPERLRALGAGMTVRVPDDLADRVLVEIARTPEKRSMPVRRWLTGLGAVVAAVGVSVAVSAPVRAAFVHVFGFGGVAVYGVPGPVPVQSPVLPGEHQTDIDSAQREVGFVVRVPAVLGRPDRLTVGDGRVVSLHYERPGGSVRIDEFAGNLGVMWDKYAEFSAQRTTVNGREALWFDQPVALAYVDAAGAQHNESTRLTDGTLVWMDGDLTFRLDGVRPLDAALAVARSMR